MRHVRSMPGSMGFVAKCAGLCCSRRFSGLSTHLNYIEEVHEVTCTRLSDVKSWYKGYVVTTYDMQLQIVSLHMDAMCQL